MSKILNGCWINLVKVIEFCKLTILFGLVQSSNGF
jgi:hypothetical protein